MGLEDGFVVAETALAKRPGPELLLDATIGCHRVCYSVTLPATRATAATHTHTALLPTGAQHHLRGLFSQIVV